MRIVDGDARSNSGSVVAGTNSGSVVAHCRAPRAGARRGAGGGRDGAGTYRARRRASTGAEARAGPRAYDAGRR